MFGRTYRLFAIRGVDIEVDVSWVIIAVLVAWTFWGRFVTVHSRPNAVAIAMAVAAAALFFASVLAHELAHALEATHRGVEVDGITLFLFGGATRTSFDVERPRDEFALTAVGPFTSLVLAAALGLVATYAEPLAPAEVAIVAGNLGWVNLALGLFNLLPGAPLDGGRILRSIVWAVTDDRGRSVRVASRSGQVIGSLIGGLGLLQIVFVPNAAVGGIWYALIGWFLFAAATGELRRREREERREERGPPDERAAAVSEGHIPDGDAPERRAPDGGA